MRAWLTAALILVAGLGICTAGVASLPYSVDVSATKSTTIPNTWIYTVCNTSPSPQYVLWLVGIEVDDGTDVLKTVTPAGWTADTESQPHFITWMYQSGELGSGEMRTGFTAQFNGTPAFQNFTALMNNSETGEAPCLDGVVSVPEPAGAAVLLTGLSPLTAFALRRRFRS